MRAVHRPNWLVDPRATVLEAGAANIVHAALNARHHARIVFGEGATIDGAFFDVGPGCEVEIGSGCRVNRGKIVVRGGSKVSIGAETTWESGVMLAGMGSSIVVGRDCMLSNQVMLRTSDGHGMFDATGQCLNPAESVRLADHVWLGNGARVSKGSSIGEGAIVGQLSLAVGPLHAYSLYVGTPARQLRTGVTWSRTMSWDDVPLQYRPPAP